MSTKFTAIFTESWMAGSHSHTLTKMLRFEQYEGETVVAALEREDIAERCVFLFLGWPALQGENEAPNV